MRLVFMQIVYTTCCQGKEHTVTDDATLQTTHTHKHTFFFSPYIFLIFPIEHKDDRNRLRRTRNDTKIPNEGNVL